MYTRRRPITRLSIPIKDMDFHPDKNGGTMFFSPQDEELGRGVEDFDRIRFERDDYVSEHDFEGLERQGEKVKVYYGSRRLKNEI